jgi:hypothetical protein
MTSEITSAKENFLKTGKVALDDEPSGSEEPASKPKSRETLKLENLSQDPWGTLTVKLPQPLLNALRLASVKRKAARLPPCSQQEIVQHLLERWLKEQGELS